MTTPTSSALENTMHDKCKNVVVFHNNLCKFFKSLKGVLPEHVHVIRECIQYYKTISRQVYLEECQTLMEPHINSISQYDYGIFTDDYATGPLILLPGMDFRQIWTLLDGEDFEDDKELQTATKKSIFNHLQTLYVSIQMALSQINVFNKNIEKQKQFLMDMMENLQMDDKIKARIEEMKLEEAEAAKNGGKGGMFSMAKLSEMLGEDNFVLQLANEVIQEMELGGDEVLENPLETITQLFADGGKKLQDIIIKVGDKIEQKVQRGEIDIEKCSQDAEALKGSMKGLIPGLDKIINGSMSAQYASVYEALGDDEKEHFSHMPAIFNMDPDSWTEEHQVQMKEYMEYLSSRQSDITEDDIDDPPQSKPKPSKSKSKSKPKQTKPKPKPASSDRPAGSKPKSSSKPSESKSSKH